MTAEDKPSEEFEKFDRAMDKMMSVSKKVRRNWTDALQRLRLLRLARGIQSPRNRSLSLRRAFCFACQLLIGKRVVLPC
jgi:hypothetical protein